MADRALQPRLPAYISINVHKIEVERFIQNKQLYYINEILRYLILCIVFILTLKGRNLKKKLDDNLGTFC